MLRELVTLLERIRAHWTLVQGLNIVFCSMKALAQVSEKVSIKLHTHQQLSAELQLENIASFRAHTDTDGTYLLRRDGSIVRAELQKLTELQFVV